MSQKQRKSHNGKPHPSFESSGGSVASPAQRRANRRNAKRSTGPRSDEGKARAAHNAVTHGAFCRDVLLPGEDPAGLCELICGTYGALSPQDALERELVDRIVFAHWRLRRLRRGERYAFGFGADRRADRDAGDHIRQSSMHGRGSRHFAALRRVIGLNGVDPNSAAADAEPRADDAEARRAFEARQSAFVHDPAERSAGLDVAQALADPAGAVERFSRIAQRLEHSASRALRELRQLQTDRRQAQHAPLPCPYLEGLDEDDEQDEQVKHEKEVNLRDARADAGAQACPAADHVPTPDATAQNEANPSQTVADDEQAGGYDGDASCTIDLAAVMKLAAADAATLMSNRRRDLKLA